MKPCDGLGETHTRYLIKPQRHPPNQHLSSTQAKTPDKTDWPRVSLLWRQQRLSCSDGPSSVGPQERQVWLRCSRPCPLLSAQMAPASSRKQSQGPSHLRDSSLFSGEQAQDDQREPPITTLHIFSSQLTTSFLGDRDSPVLPWSLSGCQVQKELEYCMTDRNWELAHGNKKLIYELHGTIHSTRQEFNIKIWL